MDKYQQEREHLLTHDWKLKKDSLTHQGFDGTTFGLRFNGREHIIFLRRIDGEVCFLFPKA